MEIELEALQCSWHTRRDCRTQRYRFLSGSHASKQQRQPQQQQQQQFIVLLTLQLVGTDQPPLLRSVRRNLNNARATPT